MEEKSGMNRREFIGTTAKSAAGVSLAVAAGPAINVLGANEMINVGLVGCGSRGQYLIGRLAMIEDPNVRVVAVADIFEGSYRDRAAETAKSRFSNAPAEIKVYKHHRELFHDKDVDAVILATPEHAHYRQIIDACEAGKDVYCEKPMLHDWREGEPVLKAVRGNKRIVQIGSQRRSVEIYQKAKELIAAGAIGQVTQVRAFWHRNFKPGEPGAAWRKAIPPDANEGNIDWVEFLGTAPYVPFSLQRIFHWRCYWDYSNGIGSDLMVHQIDAAIMVMGATMPRTVVSSGDIYRWNDGRTTCDTWSSILEYPTFQLTYSSMFSNMYVDCGEMFFGTEGTLWIDGNNAARGMKIIAEPEKIRSKDVEETTIEMEGDADTKAVSAHMRNWVECMRSRKKPNCDVDDGFYGGVTASMAVMSYFEGRRVGWDPERQVVV
jgi:predicted dehydrogenase